MAKAINIKHIGIMRALCDGRKRASLREDLGADRYRQLGISERLRDQAPYRICRACIKRVTNLNFMVNRWRTKNRRPANRSAP